MVSTVTAALHPLFTRHDGGGKIYEGRQGCQLRHIISGVVVVVYPVTIVVFGHGLLQKCWYVVIGWVLRNAGSFRI